MAREGVTQLQHGEPPKLLLPLENSLPLPHLPCVSFFRSPNNSPTVYVHPRPVSPTPRRMMSNNSRISSNTSNSTPHRRQSLIPRPTSSTARESRPLGYEPADNVPPSNRAIDQPSLPSRYRARNHRESINTRTHNPPTSFSMQRANMPPSDTPLLMEPPRPKPDLSGIYQQLHLRDYSIRSFSGPDKVPSSSATSFPYMADDLLSKSKISKSLTNNKQDISTGRRLLGPVGPPMPRSQTFGNMSSYSNPRVGNASSSLSAIHRKSEDSANTTEAQIDLYKALREGRMTDEEVEILDQVFKDAEANRKRLNQQKYLGCGQVRSRATDPAFLDSSFRQSNATSSIHLSPNDIIYRDGPEAQQRGSSTKRPQLSIDTTVAQARQRPVFPMTVSTPSQNVITTSVPDDEWLSKNGMVWSYLDLSTWSGRYMSLCDQIRTRDSLYVSSNFAENPALPSQVTLNAFPTDERLEQADGGRQNEALNLLRSYCMSNEALQSFERFERIVRPTRDTYSRSRGMNAGPTREQIERLQRSTANFNNAMDLARSKINSKNIFRRSGFLFPDATSSSTGSLTFQPGSELPSSSSLLGPQIIHQEIKPALSKSKTVGNLAALNSAKNESWWTNGRERRKEPGISTDRDVAAERRLLVLRQDKARKRVEETRKLAKINSEGSNHASNVKRQSTDLDTPKEIFRKGDDLFEVASQNIDVKGKAAVKDFRPGFATESTQKWVSTSPSLECLSSGLPPLPIDPDAGLPHPYIHRRGAIAGSYHDERMYEEAQPSVTRRRADDPSAKPRVQKAVMLRKRSGRQSSGEFIREVLREGKDIVKGAGKGVRKMARSFTNRSEVDDIPEREYEKGSDSVKDASEDERKENVPSPA